MDEKPILVSIGNRIFILEKPSEAMNFMGLEHVEALSQLVLEEIVARLYILRCNVPVRVVSNSSNSYIIEELKRSLKVLGMKNIEDQIEGSYDTQIPKQS